mmetsp:Transcript_6105/g.15587  ORF Transcript_6105/g.15587 Transcript_6105/m.15587 type:complete len:234 (-) Transcript_6105:142-843(-)
MKRFCDGCTQRVVELLSAVCAVDALVCVYLRAAPGATKVVAGSSEGAGCGSCPAVFCVQLARPHERLEGLEVPRAVARSARFILPKDPRIPRGVSIRMAALGPACPPHEPRHVETVAPGRDATHTLLRLRPRVTHVRAHRQAHLNRGSILGNHFAAPRRVANDAPRRQVDLQPLRDERRCRKTTLRVKFVPHRLHGVPGAAQRIPGYCRRQPARPPQREEGAVEGKSTYPSLI